MFFHQRFRCAYWSRTDTGVEDRKQAHELASFDGLVFVYYTYLDARISPKWYYIGPSEAFSNSEPV
jgi:hypothetical protein